MRDSVTQHLHLLLETIERDVLAFVREASVCNCHLNLLVLKERNYLCESYQFIAFVICHFPFLLQHVSAEPFEPSPFMPSVDKEFEEGFNFPTNRQQQTDAEPLGSLPKSEKENNSVAKIKVVVSHSLDH